MTSSARQTNYVLVTAVYLAALLALVLWAGTTVANKYAVRTIDPVSVALMRALLAAAIVIPLLLLFAIPKPNGRIEWWQAVASGGFNFLAWPLPAPLT